MNRKESLQRSWEKYTEEDYFNYTVLEDFLMQYGQEVTFKIENTIVMGDEFPEYIYFIKEGIGVGKRNYADGNEYIYFQVDNSNGNLGLLEVLARKEAYISTVTCSTQVTAIKIPAHLVYEKIMSDTTLLRRCSVLLAQDLYRTSGNEGLLYRFQGIDRVRHYLIKYYEEHQQSGSPVTVEADYQEIAYELGISVRTVGRSIKRLKELQEVGGQKRKLLLKEAHYLLSLKRLNR